MRSRKDVELKLEDPYSDDAVFSLLPVARERILAGTARHSMMKVFDFRMPSGRMYDYLDTAGIPAYTAPVVANGSTAGNVETQAVTYYSDPKLGWNCFLSPKGSAGMTPHRRSYGSPLYSLSSPSPASPTIFAGTEGQVLELNAVSTTDPHPDTRFAAGIRRDRHGRVDSAKSWNPQRDVTNLSMFAQAEGRLYLQSSVGSTGHTCPNLDDRWHLNNQR